MLVDLVLVNPSRLFQRLREQSVPMFGRVQVLPQLVALFDCALGLLSDLLVRVRLRFRAHVQAALQV